MLTTVKPKEKPPRNIGVVLDNGRRGEPLSGCDCMQCFGMCMVDRDVATRDQLAKGAKPA